MSSVTANQSAGINQKRTSTKKNKNRKGENVGIPVRKLGQNYGEDVPLLWFGDNSLLSALFAGFSAVLVSVEDQLVYSARLYQDKVTDPILKEQIRAFIGQEAHHSREHEAFNRALIERGFKLQGIIKFTSKMNKWARKRQSPADQLANAVCAEHFTALLADYALRSDFLNHIPEPAKKLWAWHAIEEIEHKNVIFDMYVQLVGDRKRLHKTMKITLIMSIIVQFLIAVSLMKNSGNSQFGNFKMWREGFSFIRKMMKDMKSDYNDFFKPDYHPWDHNALDLLVESRKKWLDEETSWQTAS